MNRLSVIIPAFDEEPTVSKLLTQVVAISLPGVEKEIIVVESRSKDRTRDVVKDFEKRGLVTAIYQETPRGKGFAVKAGLARATGDWVIIQDADLEYSIADYPKLLAPLQSGQTSFVLGSRHLGHEGWQYRSRSAVGPLLAIALNAAVWAYTQFFNVLYGVHLTDPTTMYKVFRRDCLTGITLRSNGFDLDWEIVAKLLRRGFAPVEVPVSYVSRGWNEGKKVRLIRDSWASFRAIVQFRFGAL